jgi:hypothetical protein
LQSLFTIEILLFLAFTFRRSPHFFSRQVFKLKISLNTSLPSSEKTNIEAES